jgi:hypothetical protein
MSTDHLSRRALVAGAASVPVLALPAVAAAIPAADDTFARIVRHRVITIQLEAICDRKGKLSQVIPADRCKRSGIWDRGTDVGKDDDPRWTAIEAEYWHVSDEQTSIAWSFVDRPPSSVEGAAALIAYADEHEAQGFEWPNCRHHYSETGRHLGDTEQDCRSSMTAVAAFALSKIGVQS